MTIDEAISHAEEVAENCEEQAKQCDIDDRYERHVMHENAKCAADHRQLAEWLRELKELREKYSAQIEVIGFLKSDNKQLDEHLKKAKRLLKQVCCDFSNKKAVRLNHLNEALQFLKLLGETNDEP